MDSENNKLPLEEEDEADALAIDEEDAGNGADKAPFADKPKQRFSLETVKKNAPFWMIYARYCLPLFATLFLFVSGFFYNVRIVSVGYRMEVSLWRLYGNTLTGMHTYLGGEIVEVKTVFYTLLTVGALVGILSFLLSLFFSALAAYTSVMAFRAGHESEAANRYKLIFKMAFPSRKWLFLSNLLLLVPAVFPHYLSFVGARFLLIGDEGTMYVLYNRPLLFVGIFLCLVAVLAIFVPRLERQKRMNMFLLWKKAEKIENGGEE